MVDGSYTPSLQAARNPRAILAHAAWDAPEAPPAGLGFNPSLREGAGDEPFRLRVRAEPSPAPTPARLVRRAQLPEPL